MASLGQFGGRLKPHRLQVRPPCGVVRNHDAMLVAKQNAGMFKDTSDRWVNLAGDFRLCAPDRSQHGRNFYRGDLVHRPREQGTGICRSEMTLPLIADLGIARFALSIGEHGFGDVPERRDRARGLA
jgi:hypothetical protein